MVRAAACSSLTRSPPEHRYGLDHAPELGVGGRSVAPRLRTPPLLDIDFGRAHAKHRVLRRRPGCDRAGGGQRTPRRVPPGKRRGAPRYLEPEVELVTGGRLFMLVKQLAHPAPALEREAIALADRDPHEARHAPPPHRRLRMARGDGLHPRRRIERPRRLERRAQLRQRGSLVPLVQAPRAHRRLGGAPLRELGADEPQLGIHLHHDVVGAPRLLGHPPVPPLGRLGIPGRQQDVGTTQPRHETRVRPGLAPEPAVQRRRGLDAPRPGQVLAQAPSRAEAPRRSTHDARRRVEYVDRLVVPLDVLAVDRIGVQRQAQLLALDDSTGLEQRRRCARDRAQVRDLAAGPCLGLDVVHVSLDHLVLIPERRRVHGRPGVGCDQVHDPQHQARCLPAPRFDRRGIAAVEEGCMEHAGCSHPPTLAVCRPGRKVSVMGETRVDLLHLLEDLRDAYPGSLEETILTEIVANALDSGARAVALTADPTAATLTVTDDGHGMSRAELRHYHDVAASTKVRGTGIGFAGIGIKLGLLACEEVLTETRRGKTHVATSWRLAGRYRAPWQWVTPPGAVAVPPARGTAVRLKLANPLSPLLDAGFLAATLQRHFRPLFDPTFDGILAGRYPQGVRCTVNGRALEREPAPPPEGRAALLVRLARKRKPSALGYLVRSPDPLPDVERGVAVSTLGKVIKQGWDWLGLAPAAPERVTGLIEAPALAGCLTLNKADFLRSGPRGALYLAYRRAIQEVVAARLAEWGEARDTGSVARQRKLRPLERDLETVLVDLARDFPLLGALVDHRSGGQRRLPLGRPNGNAAIAAGKFMAQAEPSAATPETVAAEPASRSPSHPPPTGGGVPLPGARGPKRPARYGLAIQFERRPGEAALGRLEESTVWVNEAHPAYRRAVASRSEGYHLALTVAMALAPLAVPAAEAHGFVTSFLTRWGETGEGRN